MFLLFYFNVFISWWRVLFFNLIYVNVFINLNGIFVLKYIKYYIKVNIFMGLGLENFCMILFIKGLKRFIRYF